MQTHTPHTAHTISPYITHTRKASLCLDLCTSFVFHFSELSMPLPGCHMGIPNPATSHPPSPSTSPNVQCLPRSTQFLLSAILPASTAHSHSLSLGILSKLYFHFSTKFLTMAPPFCFCSSGLEETFCGHGLPRGQAHAHWFCITSFYSLSLTCCLTGN